MANETIIATAPILVKPPESTAQPGLLPGSILSLSALAAERLLAEDHGDAALLYLHRMRNISIPADLPWPQIRLEQAQHTLVKLGLAFEGQQNQQAACYSSGAMLPAEGGVRPAPAPPDPSPAQLTPPEYTTEEITSSLGEAGSEFTIIANQVERQLGKKLSVNDLKTLFVLYDHLAMPTEVILLLVTWCIEEQERKYGPGRRPFMSQIRREGFIWARKGVETIELAEVYLKRQLLLNSKEGEILSLLNLPVRPLVTKEKSFVSAWHDMGFDSGALRMAYEKTVMKKGSLEWSYMNGILRRWNEKGLHTTEAIVAGDREFSHRARPQGGNSGQLATMVGTVTTPPPPEQERRVKEDMERMRRLMSQMNVLKY